MNNKPCLFVAERKAQRFISKTINTKSDEAVCSFAITSENLDPRPGRQVWTIQGSTVNEENSVTYFETKPAGFVDITIDKADFQGIVSIDHLDDGQSFELIAFVEGYARTCFQIGQTPITRPKRITFDEEETKFHNLDERLNFIGGPLLVALESDKDVSEKIPIKVECFWEMSATGHDEMLQFITSFDLTSLSENKLSLTIPFGSIRPLGSRMDALPIERKWFHSG